MTVTVSALNAIVVMYIHGWIMKAGFGCCFSSMLDATKIVPIEASPADVGSADADPTTQDTSPKKGFQEYAIQQAAYEVPLKANR